MLVSQAEWARRHGFSRQYVSKLIASGVIHLVDGRIDWDRANQRHDPEVREEAEVAAAVARA